MNIAKIASIVSILALVIGCGGGGGSAGTTPGSGPSGSQKVATYVSEISKPTLNNSGADTVTLTITVLDAANNPVPEAAVAVSVDSGVYTPAGTATDASGKQTGTVSIGGNKTDRNITATINVNGISKTVVIPVVGTQITLTPVPAIVEPGQTINLDVAVTDSAGVGIGNIAVELGGNAGFAGSINTDRTGKASARAIAGQTEGDLVVSAKAGGATASKPVKVLRSGSASIPDASGSVVARSLTANPATVAPNVSGGGTNRAKLSAKFLQNGNAGIANMRVRFELVGPVLGAGEYISTGDSFVYSDSAGTAEAEYIPGTRTSPTNGVKVRACYSNSDFPRGSCPASVEANLTVNSQPLAISIGNFNKLEAAQGGLIYNERFVIQIADASGVAVPDAVVSASVDITHFGKGAFGRNYRFVNNQAPGISLIYTGNFQAPGSIPGVDNYTPDLAPSATQNIWCVNEDRNRNGFLESGEDLNGDGNLTPRKSEVVVSFVNGNRTDSSGQLLVQVSYPQNVGSWLAYTLKATTSVVGSEGSNERSFVSGVLEADVPNGSFLTPPYGAQACNARL